MKKKLNILGRKVPVLAVMMVILVIGTASAALIGNYATLTGTFEVTPTIIVTGDVTENVALLDIADGTATFTIANSGDAPEEISLNTILYYNGAEDRLINTEGTTITYTVGSTSTEAIDVNTEGAYDGFYDPVLLTAEVTTTTVTVTFGADPALVTGDYMITVEVNPVP